MSKQLSDDKKAMDNDRKRIFICNNEGNLIYLNKKLTKILAVNVFPPRPDKEEYLRIEFSYLTVEGVEKDLDEISSPKCLDKVTVSAIDLKMMPGCIRLWNRVRPEHAGTLVYKQDALISKESDGNLKAYADEAILNYTQMALSIASFAVPLKELEMIIGFYEKVKIERGDFSLRDASKIMARVEAKYDKSESPKPDPADKEQVEEIPAPDGIQSPVSPPNGTGSPNYVVPSSTGDKPDYLGLPVTTSAEASDTAAPAGSSKKNMDKYAGIYEQAPCSITG